MPDKIPLIGVLLSLAAFAAAPAYAGEHLRVAQFLAGLVGFVALAVHVLNLDEVERLLVWKAGAVGFAGSLVGAWAAATIGLPAVWHLAWALMMGLWLVAYAALRWWPR